MYTNRFSLIYMYMYSSYLFITLQDFEYNSMSYTVGSYCLSLLCMWKWKPLSHVQPFVTPWAIQSMEFSGPEYWSGSPSLLQGTFTTHRLNSGLLYCRGILYQLSHQGNPRILVWVAYSFSSGSSRPRNRTRVSCIAGRFFTSWATICIGVCIC